MEAVNKEELLEKIKFMYKEVAEKPDGEFHFEMGRPVAEKLGYSPEDLDNVPKEAVESFAGVGHYFDFAGIKEGETILDLGSGSGMDAFIAAIKAGKSGKVIGFDLSKDQLRKANMLKEKHDFSQAEFREGYIESLPLEDESVDVVISNGVINLSAEKDKVFKEISRVLKKGGRMAISDIVTEKPLTEKIKCDANIWASCIGGALQINTYKELMEKAGLKVVKEKHHPEYGFLSKSARNASDEFGVKSFSFLAEKQ